MIRRQEIAIADKKEHFDDLIASLGIITNPQLFSHLVTLRNQAQLRGHNQNSGAAREAARHASAILQTSCGLNEKQASDFISRIRLSSNESRKPQYLASYDREPEFGTRHLEIAFREVFPDSTITLEGHRGMVHMIVTGEHAERDGRQLRELCNRTRQKMGPEFDFATFSYAGGNATVKVQEGLYNVMTTHLALEPDDFTRTAASGRGF